MKTGAALAALILLAVLTGAVVLPTSDPAPAGAPTPVRDYLLEHGLHETGAVNLVAAVYLGYRLYDTLGEAIVLLLAVSAILFVLESER